MEELLHEGQPVPPLNTVVVINRARGGGADFGWLPDATHFCLVSLHGRDVVKQLECGSLPAEEDAHTAAAGPFMRWLHPEKFPFYLAIVFNKPGPFRFTSGPGPTYGPLHQATAVFASGETATFLEYDSIQHRIEPREICNTDHSACFQTDDIPSLGTVTIEESESPTP
ncbi:hypothetical protein [Streptomyces sp. NPDC001530]|uniref:hypothetical protein n=1 Tax=Streptomyces sp. NPDC001530 TaxID=3364582 RepID=UPI00369DE781